MTPTGTPTSTPTETFTATATADLTPILRPPARHRPSTFGGFLVQGQGCANIAGGDGGGDGAMPLLVLAAFALLRRLRL